MSLVALHLPAPGSCAHGRAVLQREGHTLAHGHYLGRGQSAEGIPAQHAGPDVHARLEMGLLHQPQCHRLPHQVIHQAHTLHKCSSNLHLNI